MSKHDSETFTPVTIDGRNQVNSLLVASDKTYPKLFEAIHTEDIAVSAACQNPNITNISTRFVSFRCI